MNYINLFIILLVCYSIYKSGRIRKNPLGLLWTLYIIAYPILDAKLRGESGLLLLDLLCYLAPLFIIIGNDSTIETLNIYLMGIKYIARFQTLGVLLSFFWKKGYYAIAWRIFGYWPSNLYGFSPDKAMTALCVCIGYAVVLSELCTSKPYLNKATVCKLLESIIYIVCIIASGKRYGFILLLITTLIIVMFTSTKDGITFFRSFLLCALLLVAVTVSSIWTYYIWGESNALGRIGSTLIGLSSGDDVTTNRLVWAEMMSRWGAENKWFGIGWESFRYRIIQEGYSGVPNGHNVFKQIQCETGYIGLCIFIGLLIITFVKVFSLVYQSLSKSYLNNLVIFTVITLVILTSFTIYCLSGNAIYDSFAYIYFFISIVFADTLLIQIEEILA